MKAYVFPGQGSQYIGMGKNLYLKHNLAKQYFDEANEILGFNITDIMFNGTEDDLKQTKITQPAIFLHSVILSIILNEQFTPDMVAGHSLGEFSALTAAKGITFEDGLKLVFARAQAMQKACEENPSTMAAVIGLDDQKVEQILSNIDDIVVAANYNSPGQIVISGTFSGIEKATEELKKAGAKRVVPLKVGGAFHSPLMESARLELAKAIEKTEFRVPICPIYQNVDAKPHLDPNQIRNNLIAQLTSPVKWSQTIRQMYENGARVFVEVGPGNVLQGLIKKIVPEAEVYGFETV